MAPQRLQLTRCWPRSPSTARLKSMLNASSRLCSPFLSSPFPSPFHFSPLSFLRTSRCVPSLPSSPSPPSPADPGGPSPWLSPPLAAPRGCGAAPRAGFGSRSPVLRLEVALHEALRAGRRGTAGTAALLRDRLRGQGTSGVSPGHRGGTGSQAQLRRPHGLCGTGSDPCLAPWGIFGHNLTSARLFRARAAGNQGLLSLPCLSLQPRERGALRVRTASGEMLLEDWAVVGFLVWPRADLKMQQVFGRAVGLPGAICWHQVPLSLTCPHGLLGAICRVRGGPDSL